MKALLVALALLPTLALGQTADSPRISLDARGEDVREVLATLFAQSKKPYALDASIKGKLYVRLDALPYDKALAIVLGQAGLIANDKDGVLVISPAPSVVKAEPKDAAQPLAKKTLPPKQSGTVPSAVFARRVTTRLSRTPLADVFAALGNQAKVTIKVAPSVPAYRVDAFFAKTSLKFALDRVCSAAGLAYAVEGAIIKVDLKR